MHMASKKKGGAKSKAAKPNQVEDEYATPAETSSVGSPQETEAPAEPAAPKPKTTKKSKKEKPVENVTGEGLTLYDISERYLAWLDEDGAGEGTISSYGMELKLAMREL